MAVSSDTRNQLNVLLQEARQLRAIEEAKVLRYENEGDDTHADIAASAARIHREYAAAISKILRDEL